MAKSDKSTIMIRTQEVLQILLAGGEFAQIRQYASNKGWDVSERQLRRYQERAYKRLASATERDQQQLLGRHLMQRRALYARALKTNDVRTALQVLKDEAELEGLYPPTKVAPTTPDGKHPYGTSEHLPLSREERFHMLLAAKDRENINEVRLIEQATPPMYYQMPDTMMPMAMLHMCTMMYVAEQLDHIGMVFAAFWNEMTGKSEPGRWDDIAKIHAYRFRIEVDAWELFTGKLSIDPENLIAQNHKGSLLELFGEHVYRIAPTTVEIEQIFEGEGQSAKRLCTAEQSAEEWAELLARVLRR